MDPGADAQTQPSASKWRRRIAILAAPLGIAPIAGLKALDAMEMASESLPTLVLTYLGYFLILGYAFGAIAGGVTWLLSAWFKLPERAWIFIGVFTIPWVAFYGVATQSIEIGLMLGLVFALPISLTYCLVAGTSWR